MRNGDHSGIILVVDDVEETRDGIEALLKADGYQVHPARNEDEAVLEASRQRPDLILVSLGGPRLNVTAIAVRIRDRAGLSQTVPLVVFCSLCIAEGAEVEVSRHTYVTRPDNFNQLRGFLARLLHQVRVTS